MNRVALACGIAGTLLLLYYSVLVSPMEMKISEIGGETIGQRVQVQGTVSWSNEKNSVLIFTLSDGNSIKGVVFGPGAVERILLEKGSRVSVVGRVEKYNGELEIVTEGVELLD